MDIFYSELLSVGRV